MAPQARLRIGTADVLLLGTIAGFVPDAERVRQAYEAFRPRVVALGIPPEDLPTLDALAAAAKDTPAELPQLDEATEKLLALLAPFGATRTPSPDLEAAHACAQADELPIEALDLDDAEHSAAFTGHVRFWHVVQSNSIKARLLKRGVHGADAYAVAANWDAAWSAPAGLRKVEEARELHMAARLRDVAAGGGNVLAVVPSVRLRGIVDILASGDAATKVVPAAHGL